MEVPTDARDMAVWRAGRILAVIRKDRDGRPEVTEFGDLDPPGSATRPGDE